MKILVTDEKHGPQYFDISAPELRIAAYRTLFEERAEDGWYDNSFATEAEETLFDRVVAGDDEALIAFMQERRDHQYEGFEEIEPKTPGTEADEEDEYPLLTRLVSSEEPLFTLPLSTAAARSLHAQLAEELERANEDDGIPGLEAYQLLGLVNALDAALKTASPPKKETTT